jgi:FKBP-type peptidyl-prolyl cis-trans isomerase
MKKFYAFLFLALTASLLYAGAIQEDNRRAEEKARMSYAFGMAIGSNLVSTGLEFDYDAFALGMKEMMEGGNTWFTEMEAVEIVENALQEASDRMADQYRVQEEFFLALNGGRPGVFMTASGLQYEVIVGTEGEKPGPESLVRVHYEGSFTDGSIFDASYSEPEGVVIPLDRVIPGWTEGIMLMSPGSKYKIYIPSSLAYGKEGLYQIIPPYSTLIFTVELLEIISPEEY